MSAGGGGDDDRTAGRCEGWVRGIGRVGRCREEFGGGGGRAGDGCGLSTQVGELTSEAIHLILVRQRRRDI